jgi:hypothetical protein
MDFELGCLSLLVPTTIFSEPSITPLKSETKKFYTIRIQRATEKENAEGE